MSFEVIIPDVGTTVSKITISKWLKQPGDRVEKGETILVIDAEKVSLEIESPASGILAAIYYSEGADVKSGAVVALIVEEGEKIDSAKGNEVSVESASTRQFYTSEEDTASHILIIGGGPGGYMAAIKAAQVGNQVTLVSKTELGGTCMHTGCMPSKAYLNHAKVYEQIKGSYIFKGQEEVTVDMSQLKNKKDAAVQKLTEGLIALLSKNGIKIIEATATFDSTHSVQCETAEGKIEKIGFDYAIIATGSVPINLPSVEVDGCKVHNTDTIWNLQQIPRRILIVGSGSVGIEFACFFNALGSKVRVIEMLSTAMPFLDVEIAAELGKCLDKKGIVLNTATRILSAKGNRKFVTAMLADPNGKERADFDLILLAAGRRPLTDGLNLEKCGVRLEKGVIAVNRRMETNVPGIYAVGDVIGGLMLAHAAFYEARVAVEVIMGQSNQVDYSKIPQCVYSFPEVASIGLTEEAARQVCPEISVARFPFYANSKAKVIGESEGLIKLIANLSTGQILGVHILGEHATELIGEYALAISAEITVEEAAAVIKGHPTLSESLTEAAMIFTGNAIHLPPSI